MNRARCGWVCVLLGACTLWGCAQEGGGRAGSASRANRLQEELQALTADRDRQRQEAQAAQERVKALQEELRSAVAQGDALRQGLAAERDLHRNHLDQFRKGVKTLLEQADACAATLADGPPAPPVASARGAGRPVAESLLPDGVLPCGGARPE